MLEDRDLARVDILSESKSDFGEFAARALLSEFLSHGLPESEQKSSLARAADESETEVLPSIADTPGFTLRDVEVRLAYAYRLLLWCDQPGNGPYGAAATRMVATSLADVVLMRTVERARPRLPETVEPSPEQEPAEAPKPEPTMLDALQQMTDLLGKMAALFGEQNQLLAVLNGQRKEEAATA